MRWRSGPDGYGVLTKLLHWATVALVAAQFAVGWSMEVEDGCDPAAEDRSGLSDAADDRLDRLEDACEAQGGELDLSSGGFDLPELHLLLGVTILLVGVVRPLWRRVDGFPPWSEALSARDRRLVHWTERALMTLLVLVPLSGILLVVTGDDGWVPLHVASHLGFFLALAAHLTTNLRPRVLRRML